MDYYYYYYYYYYIAAVFQVTIIGTSYIGGQFLRCNWCISNEMPCNIFNDHDIKTEIENDSKRLLKVIFLSGG